MKKHYMTLDAASTPQNALNPERQNPQNDQVKMQQGFYPYSISPQNY